MTYDNKQNTEDYTYQQRLIYVNPKCLPVLRWLIRDAEWHTEPHIEPCNAEQYAVVLTTHNKKEYLAAWAIELVMESHHKALGVCWRDPLQDMETVK